MKKTTLLAGSLLLSFLLAGTAKAQLSKNPDKFLGNITTRGQVNGGGYEYKTKWNQLTCENETKWASVQGNGASSWNWGGADNAYNYCKKNGLLFKFHCLAWGSQYPSWIESLSYEDRYQAIVKWMDAIKKRYPDLEMFDVVNEAVQGHQSGTHFFEEALGGKGESGYDWIIKAFELAHERWPNAILIYNDFNTFQWQRQQFIDLCKALRDYGAPIDAYGCQSHDLTGYSLSSFKQAVDEIQNALKMPMYSTEYDIGTDDDNQQLTNYKEQIPYMWEKDYFAGLTLWGSTYGATWTTNGNSGILGKNGKNRPAYDWLVEYMATEKARTAKSPFPGMRKEADLYIKPQAGKIAMGEVSKIDLRAKLRKKTIDHIDFYANDKLYTTLVEAPWVVDFEPSKQGTTSLKAVMVATDDTEYVRYGSVNVVAGRSPYKTLLMPGIVQAEDFDKGLEGSAYHDSDRTNTGNKTYRNNETAVDFNSGNGGTVVSKTEDGEWLEYTINVKEEGLYSYDLTAASGVKGSTLNLQLKTDTGYVNVTDDLVIPCVKKDSWSTYKALHGRFLLPMKAGKQIFRLNVVKGGAYIDKIQFKKVKLNEDLALSVSVTPERVYEKDTVLIRVEVPAGADALKDVAVYVNRIKQKNFSKEPFELEYVPTEDGLYEVMAFATDTLGQNSPFFAVPLQVEKKRIPYNGVKAVPGIIEAEDFDSMGEGYSFHDTDDVDEGGANYRKDNEGVDISKANDGYVVSHVAKDEWLDYTIDVEKAGIYDVNVTASTGTDRGQYQLFLLEEDGTETPLLAKRYIPAYKDLSKYRTTKTYTNSIVPAGKHVLRIRFFLPFNFDKMELAFNAEKTEAVSIQEVATQQAGIYNVYAPSGALLGQVRLQEGESLNAKLFNVVPQAGTYVLMNIATAESRKVLVR